MKLAARVAVAIAALSLCAPAVALEQVTAQKPNAAAASASVPATATAPAAASVSRNVVGDQVEVTVPPSDEAQTYKIPVKTFIDGIMPYLVSAVGALIAVLGAAFAAILKQKFNVDIDKKHLDTFQTAATNAAGALLARGAVAIEERSGKITVSNPDMVAVLDHVAQRIPDALAHLGLTPDQVRATVIAKIPQLMATGQIAVPTIPPKAA